MVTTPGKTTPKQNEQLDDALADSFPASDPVSPTVPHQSVRADEKHIVEHSVSRDEKDQKKSS